jgi:hypothetical protein
LEWNRVEAFSVPFRSPLAFSIWRTDFSFIISLSSLSSSPELFSSQFRLLRFRFVVKTNTWGLLAL